MKKKNIKEMSPKIRSFLSQTLENNFEQLLQAYQEKKYEFEKRNKLMVYIINIIIFKL